VSVRATAGADGHRVGIVIPVKPFRDAKRRLAPLLAPHERAVFARVMYLDVLTSVTRGVAPADVFVVTADPEAAVLATGMLAQVVHEDAPAGMSEAVAVAAAQLVVDGYDGMLVIPADVPLITVGDVHRVLADTAAGTGTPALASASMANASYGSADDCTAGLPAIPAAVMLDQAVTIVPSGGDGGTNALCCPLPNAIPFCFGHDSARRHAQEAGACGLAARILRLERVALDIDKPADVATLLAYAASTRSRAWLRGLDIQARLALHAGAAS